MALGRVIGTAYVSIEAKTEGFRSGLGKVGGAIGKIGGAIGGLGLASYAQEAIDFGADTTMALDNASAMFKGLTSSQAEADDLMRRMTQYAIDTPFEMPGLSKMGAQLLAVGKGFGVNTTNMFDYIDTIGNVTAASGGNAETMERITRVLGQMSSSGKVLGQDMNQLAQNIPGLDVWGALAEGTGKSVKELRELQDQGKLDELLTGNEAVTILLGAMNKFPGAGKDAATGLDAMDRKMDTLEGQMMRFKETLGLALAKGLKPFFDVLTKMMSDPAIQSAISDLIAIFAEFMSLLVEELAPVMPDLMDAFKQIMKAVIPLTPAIADIVEIFAILLINLAPAITLLSQVVSWVTNLLVQLDPAILMAIAAALTALWLGFTGPIVLVIAAVAGAAVLITKNWDTIKEGFQQMVDGIVAAWDWLYRNVIEKVVNFVGNIVKFFTDLYNTLIGNSIIPDLINGIIEWWNFLWGIVEGIVNGIRDVIVAVWEAIKTGVETVVGAIATVIEWYFNLYKTIIETAINGAKAIIEGVWNGIKWAIETAVGLIKVFLETEWNGIKTIAETVWNGIKAAVMTPIEAVRDLLGPIIETIAGWFDFAGLVDTVTGVWEGVKNAILTPIQWLADHIGGIVDKIKGPVEGVVGTVGKIGGFVGGLIPGNASGAIITRPTLSWLGEGGRPEAVIPLTNPGRAMQLMQQSGLDRLAAQMGGQNGWRGGPLVSMPGAVIQDATDADLVAQRTLVALQAAMV